MSDEVAGGGQAAPPVPCLLPIAQPPFSVKQRPKTATMMSAARLLARRLPPASNRSNAAVGQLRSMGNAQSFVSI